SSGHSRLLGAPTASSLLWGHPLLRVSIQPSSLSLLIGSLAVIDSSGSQWLPLPSQLMRRGSPGIAETPLHIDGLKGALVSIRGGWGGFCTQTVFYLQA
ncbi:unnamed protein product, partial [Staurois parvus]